MKVFFGGRGSLRIQLNAIDLTAVSCDWMASKPALPGLVLSPSSRAVSVIKSCLRNLSVSVSKCCMKFWY